MKSEAETQQPIEGPEASARFDALVRKVIAVPHKEIMRREAEYQKTRPGLHGKKRGRKPKVNLSASDPETGDR